MKLSDYVVDFFVRQGVKYNFCISGGAVIHLIDSSAKNPEMNTIFTQHEQAAGAAADMYSRVTRNIGLAMTTSGPGATNLVTSVCNAYFDSIPVVFISGQVSRARIRQGKALRQKGFQETDIVSIFYSITKYATLLLKAQEIRYELEKAVYLAKEGRPGPVLLDIPDDLQREDVSPDGLPSYSPKSSDISKKYPSEKEIKEITKSIKEAKRPVLILGAGIRQAGVEAEAVKFSEMLHLPVLLTWGAKDILPDEHVLNMGGLGVVGPRAGNFAAQNSDLVMAMGTRLSQMITGGVQNLFAPKAKKIMIDIDSEELDKFDKDSFEIDLSLNYDLKKFFKSFFEVLNGQLSEEPRGDTFSEWCLTIQGWKREYPICLSEYFDIEDRINAYVFFEEFSKCTKERDVIITDAGGNLSWTMQALKIKRAQRVFSAWNHSPMGYSLPAAIGASFAAEDDQNIFCIIGDGGLMMCLEELATIRRHNLPIKIFIFNNLGHGIQKQTIDTWLDSHYVGVDYETGLYFPDFSKIAEAFEIGFEVIENHRQIPEKITKIMSAKEPILIDVFIRAEQKIEPMLKIGAGIEDLDPKLPKENLESIMEFSK